MAKRISERAWPRPLFGGKAPAPPRRDQQYPAWPSLGQDTYVEIRSPTDKNVLGVIAVASITSLMKGANLRQSQAKQELRSQGIDGEIPS